MIQIQAPIASLVFLLLITGCGGGGSSAPVVPASTSAADTTPPVITLTGAEQIVHVEGSDYLDPGASAFDEVDGSVPVVVSGSIGSEPGLYTITFTAVDAAGNQSTRERSVLVEAALTETASLIVLSGALPGETWDLGFNAFDEGLAFELCANDNGLGCPNIDWVVVNDSARGAVLEIRHSSVGLAAGFFIKSSAPQDLTDFAGGVIEFDVKVISGAPELTMKVDCIFPCTSGNYDLGQVSDTTWETISVPVNDLVAQDLDLSQVDTGIVIWASTYTNTVFRLDNVRWVTADDVIGGETVIASSDNEPWLNPQFSGHSSPLSYTGYALVWADEFVGSELDLSTWNYEIGNGDSGWGNNELQYYRAENTSVQEGLLVISVKEENFGGLDYTSSRLTTQNKFSFQYGRVDVRAVMPAGQGLWPAIWMLGKNISTVGWPDSGEIDVMEMIGGSGREDTVHGTAHWSHQGSHAQFGDSYQLPDPETLANGFHVYSLVWTENSLQWYVDDVLYNTMVVDPDESEGLAAFRAEFFLIVNVAVGGNWPGSPNANTDFTQFMLVDYIRVFQSE